LPQSDKVVYDIENLCLVQVFSAQTGMLTSVKQLHPVTVHLLHRNISVSEFCRNT